jgi:hypothetical protein
MLAIAVQEEPGRKSFLDIPGEIRDMIYELALFGNSEDKSLKK